MNAELSQALLIDRAVISLLDERLPGPDPARRMLARAGGRDVRDLGQPSVAQVLVVLVEVHDAAEALRISRRSEPS